MITLQYNSAIREYKDALISSISSITPSFNIIVQRGEIRLFTNNIFIELSRVASEQQVIDGLRNFKDSTVGKFGTLTSLSTVQLLSVFNSDQFGIPQLTYATISGSIQENVSNIALIALTVQTIGMIPCKLRGFTSFVVTTVPIIISEIEQDEILYDYLERNLRSVVANPDISFLDLSSLLQQSNREDIIACLQTLYDPFRALKYRDITDCDYIQPLQIPSIQIIAQVVTTVISDRLQIPAASIQTQVAAIDTTILTALLISIDNFPRIRTAVIKNNLLDLDDAIVTALTSTKFANVRELFTQVVEPNKDTEAIQIFNQVLRQDSLTSYTPILMEMYYIGPEDTAINIARCRVSEIAPLQKYMYDNLNSSINWLISDHPLPPAVEGQVEKTISDKRGTDFALLTETEPIPIVPTTIDYCIIRY